MKKSSLWIPLLSIVLTSCNNAPVEKSPLVVNSRMETNPPIVIVVGSEPEGITAAVTAARSNNKVYIIDKNAYVGGLFTVGMMSALDLNFIPQKRNMLLHEGFFREFYNEVAHGGSFDVKRAKNFFENVINSHNITYIPNVTSYKPIMDGSKVVGIQYIKENETVDIFCDFVIDASPEAQIARAAGVPYWLGREELGLTGSFAAATLVFSIKNANWNTIIHYLKNDGDILTGAADSAAWGYPEMYLYPAKQNNIQMRGLNMSRQDDGSIIINALLVFGVNPLDEESCAIGVESAKKELPYVIAYMREHLPGFQGVELGDVAEKLYIREGVRIVGEQTLRGEHVFEHTVFDNRVAYGSYPIDLQASYKGGYGNALCGSRSYSIPLGVMIPKGVDNILVVGRSASFDIISHGSARTVPVLMAMGEAAGVAANYALETNQSIRIVNQNSTDIAQIQKRLSQNNIDFNIEMPKNKDSTHWSYPYIVQLRRQGFISALYDNNLRLEEDANIKVLCTTLSLIKQHSPLAFDSSITCEFPEKLSSKELLVFINNIMKKNYTHWEEAYNANVIDKTTLNHLTNDPVLKNGHIYAVLEHLVQTLYADAQMERYNPLAYIRYDPPSGVDYRLISSSLF